MSQTHRLLSLTTLTVLICAAVACGGGSDTNVSPTTTATVAAPSTQAAEPSVDTPSSEATVAPTPTAAPVETTSTVAPTPTPAAPAVSKVVLHGGGYPTYEYLDGGAVPVPGTPVVHLTAEGLPRVVYLAGRSTIEMASCADPGCETIDTVTLIDIAPAGQLSLGSVGFTGGGRPMALYSGFNNPDAPRESDRFSGVLWCLDDDCAAIETRTARSSIAAFATSPNERRYASMAGIGAASSIALVDCSVPLCSPEDAHAVLYAQDRPLEQVLGFGPNSTPVFAFTTRSEGPGAPDAAERLTDTLHYAGCADISCTDVAGPLPLFEGEAGWYVYGLEPPQVANASVTIFFLYGSGASNDAPSLMVATCDDLSCSAPSVTELPIATWEIAAAVGADGLPRFAWTEPQQLGGARVNFTRCLDAACAATDAVSLDATAERLTMTVGEDTVYIATGPYPAELLVCPADTCRP